VSVSNHTSRNVNIDNFDTQDRIGFIGAPPGRYYAVRIPAAQIMAAVRPGRISSSESADFQTSPADASVVRVFAEVLLTHMVSADGAVSVDLARPLERVAGPHLDFVRFVFENPARLGAMVQQGIRTGRSQNLFLVLAGTDDFARGTEEAKSAGDLNSRTDADLDERRSRPANAGARWSAYAKAVLLPEPRTMNILLIDDHALFREGLKFLLRSLDAALKVDDAGDCAKALEQAAARSYELVLLDLKMPGVQGLDALTALREAIPSAPLVVLSGEDNPGVVRAAIERGAMGFIPKSSTPEVLIQALRLVLAHGVYLPPAVLDGVGAAPSPASAASQSSAGQTALPGLTPRQMDVLRCVIQGKSNKLIARELDVSEGTVKAHLSSVLRALDARNRTEAVYAAAKLGLRLV
jgi:DNA-binding NarL/FixJ family response regulator